MMLYKSLMRTDPSRSSCNGDCVPKKQYLTPTILGPGPRAEDLLFTRNDAVSSVIRCPDVRQFK
jgi:hypothetical protein